MKNSMKKILAAAALLALGALPAPEAAAYRQVCMKAKFGIGYAFQFRVAWGVDYRPFHAARRDGRPYNVDGVTGWSGNVHLAKTQCIPVSHIPPGTQFVVQLRSAQSRYLCRDWGDRDVFTPKSVRERADKTLWLDAWGQLPNPRCKAWKFE